MPRQITGAALLAGSSVLYVVAEVVSAAAWHTPGYRYWHNNISDLGSPTCPQVYQERLICSPQHVVMNGGFVVVGILFLIGIYLLWPAINHAGAAGRSVAVLSAVHGIGVILVGLFPASDANLNSAGIIGHIVGAAATIIAGNILAIVLAQRSARLGWPSRFPPVAMWTGIVGIAAFLILSAGSSVSEWIAYRSGLYERISVYTTIALACLIAYAAPTTTRRAAQLSESPAYHRLPGGNPARMTTPLIECCLERTPRADQPSRPPSARHGID